MPTRSQAKTAKEAADAEPKVQNIIDIELKKQIHPFACYSAVAEAVLKHYGIKKSQKEICDLYPKNKNGKDGMQDPIYVLKKNRVFNGSEGGVPQFHMIQAEINDRRPIICKVEEHYILLVGYDSHSNVYLKDPIKGNGRIEMSYDDFESKGLLTKYPTKDNHNGVEAHYKVGGYYLTKPPAAKKGGGRGTRRATIIERTSRMRRGTRRQTRRKLRGGGRKEDMARFLSGMNRMQALTKRMNNLQREGKLTSEQKAEYRALKEGLNKMEKKRRSVEKDAYKLQKIQEYLRLFLNSGAYNDLPAAEKKEAIKNAAIAAAESNTIGWLLEQPLNNANNTAALEDAYKELGLEP